jgi:hypothetical protein
MNQIKNNFIMSPGYISGLTQTDGSFFCSLAISSKYRFGIQFRPKFTITTDLDSKYVLDTIKLFFNCGNVRINNKYHTAEFEVEKIEELNNIIIPHFLNYPVFCAKLHAFNLFKEIVNALFNKDKRTKEGRIELLKLALSMNTSSNRKEERINYLFSLLGEKKNINISLYKYNDITEINNPLSNNHISGIIDGDGSFFISFLKNGEIKTGFNITNDKASKPLLERIQKQLNNIGSIHEGSKNELVYTVNGLNQIIDILIPFMDNNPIFSEKALHYEKFKIVSLMLKNKKDLTLENKLKIVELAYEMNKKGKHRNFSKIEYIKLLIELNK